MAGQGGTNFNDEGTSGGASVTHYFTNNAGNWIFVRASTANIPSAAAGYAIGCILEATDTGLTYRNTGSTTSSSFVQTNAYQVISVDTAGTVSVDVFGTTNGFPGTVRAVYVIALDGTAGTITVSDTAGTVATIAKGTVSGAMVGATSLTNTSFTAAGFLRVVSSVGAGEGLGGQAKVFIEYSA